MCKTIYKTLFLIILFTCSVSFSNLEASYSESCYSGIVIKNYTYLNSNYKSKVINIGINYLSKLDKYNDNQKYEKLLQIVVALKKIGVNEGINNAKSDIINILVDFFECETIILNNKISSNNTTLTSSTSTKWNVKSQGNTVCSEVGGGTGSPAKLSTNTCTLGETVYQRTNCTQADIDTQTIYMWTNYECVSGN